MPITVANFLAVSRSGAYVGSSFNKILPGQYITLGRQGNKRFGNVDISAVEGVGPNPEVLASASFRLSHLRPGTVSLNLSGGWAGWHV